MSTTAIGGPGGATSLAQTMAGNQKLGQGEFLKLLITQLTNQDPLSPQDDKEFLAQMAQFSAVEGISDLNTSLNRAQAAAFINKTVDANVLQGGTYNTVTGTVKAVTYQSDGVHLLLSSPNGDRDVRVADLTKVSG